MNRTVLITGATSGIGQATARVFAKSSFRLVLCGRRKERLNKLQKEFSELTQVHTLCFDISDRNAVEKAMLSLPDSFSDIDVLINNAGNAHGLAPIQSASLDDIDTMMNTNVKGLVYISKLVINKMITKNSGHIINIGSIAGKEVYPSGNVYCASKHAVDVLSKAMRIELNPYNIKVGAIHPGLVETEFSQVRFKGDKQRAKQVYKGFSPLTAQDIAEVIYFAVTRPPHVNIADLLILPTAQADSRILKRES